MQKSKKRYISKPSRNVVIAVLVLFVTGLSYAGYRMFIADSAPPSKITARDGQEINLRPATSSEKQEADDNKDEIVKKEAQANSTSTSSTQNKTSSVVIASASSSGVRAYVVGVFEDNGVCSASATQGSKTLAKSSSGFKNVSYTQCTPIYWDSALSNGTWTIQVSYKSGTTESVQVTNIEVQ